MQRLKYQILPLTRLKRSARRSFLGKVEHAGVRFIVTDYGEAVAELGPLSESAEQFLAQMEIEGEGDPDLTSHSANGNGMLDGSSDDEFEEEHRQRSGT